MKRMIYSALVALTAISATLPVLSTSAEARRGRGLAIGAGVVLGATALAIAANRNRAYAGERYHSYDGASPSQCRRWHWRCEDGSGWACRKYDRHC
jgi:hypothetical protein